MTSIENGRLICDCRLISVNRKRGTQNLGAYRNLICVGQTSSAQARQLTS